MKTYFKATLLFIFILLLNGCFHYQNNEELPSEVLTLPNYYSQDFKYPDNLNSPKVISNSETSDYRVTAYTLKSSCDLLHPDQAPHEIKYEVYLPRRVQSKSTILCLPISGGNYLVSRYFAEYFAKRGFTCAVIYRRRAYKNMITVDNLNTIIRQMIIDHKQVIDKLITEKISPSESFAVIGVSKGGLKAGLLAALDPRIKAAVVAIAGGDLPYILTHSEESGVKKRRLKYLKKTGFSALQFHDKLKENLKYDPLTLAPYFDSKKLLIVNAYFDNCVPYYTGKLLVDAHPGCQEILLLTGHYTALPAIPYLSIKFKNFLSDKLK